MKKDLAKYNNQFNLTDLNKLKTIEQDIFFTICSAFTQKQTETITLDFKTLKTKSALITKNYTVADFQKFILSTNNKILNVIFTVVEDNGTVKMMPLFKQFKTSIQEENVVVTLNDCFAEYLYNIPEKIAFSQFELEAFLSLKSKYTKTLFRYLLQNFTGKWGINFNRFRDSLGFPASYSNSKILARIDDTMKQIEATGYFSDINYEIEKEKIKGNPISEITFSYKINKEKIIVLQKQNTLDLTPSLVEKVVGSDYVRVIDKSGYERIRIDKKIGQLQEKCCCGADVVVKQDKKGNKYKCCTNNRYWKLGDKNCDWRSDNY